jgi:hypothetical protein
MRCILTRRNNFLIYVFKDGTIKIFSQQCIVDNLEDLKEVLNKDQEWYTSSVECVKEEYLNEIISDPKTLAGLNQFLKTIEFDETGLSNNCNQFIYERMLDTLRNHAQPLETFTEDPQLYKFFAKILRNKEEDRKNKKNLWQDIFLDSMEVGGCK